MKYLITLVIAILLQFSSYGQDSCQSFTQEFIAKSQSKSSVLEYKKYLFLTVDTKYITKFSLGANWKSLTPSQRKEFYDVYSQYIVNKYAVKFAKYPSIAHKIVDTKDDEKRKGICRANVIITTIINGEKKDIPLGAIVSIDENQFKIQDITFENVSMLQTHKQEISSLLNSKGFSGTIATLKEFIASEK